MLSLDWSRALGGLLIVATTWGVFAVGFAGAESKETEAKGARAGASVEGEDSEKAVVQPPASIVEARARAVLLHETIHGALQVMHRDFFDDENPVILPSQSLDDEFAELGTRFGVRVRWLTGNADEMNTSHRLEGPFETEAIEVLKKGADRHEAMVDGSFRYVGRVRLASQCLKCHVQRRTTLEDRFAGLSLTIPLAQ